MKTQQTKKTWVKGTMALQHKIGDAVNMRIDSEHGVPVIEIQFKFVRYRLVMDNEQWGWKLQELIEMTLNRGKRVVEDTRKMPTFYKNAKSNGEKEP